MLPLIYILLPLIFVNTLSVHECRNQECNTSEATLILDQAYPADIGYTVNENAITLYNFASPRLYLTYNGSYAKIPLLGRQIQFDIDVSAMPCGSNAALYVSDMPLTMPSTGYCDAQGDNGAGCNEFDIYEGNAIANAFTSHSCSDQTCDKSGCGINTKDTSLQVDTSKPFTIITQFITSNDLLSEVKQQYIQNNQLYEGGSIYPCGTDGGFDEMRNTLAAGMVLVISVWGGSYNMEWLDRCSPESYDLTSITNAYATFSNISISDIGTQSILTTEPQVSFNCSIATA